MYAARMSRYTFWSWIFLVQLLSFLNLASTSRVNVTIDDTYDTEIEYSPSEAWQPAGAYGSSYPEPEKSFNYTWTASMYYPANDSVTDEYGPEASGTPDAQLEFTGTAIYVYGIVGQNVAPSVSFTNMSFYVDGNFSFNYANEGTSDGGEVWEYGVPMFSQDDLQNGTHTLRISNGGGSNQSYGVIDYIVYTQELSDLSNTSTTSIVPPTQTSIAPPTFTVSSASTSSSSRLHTLAPASIAGIVVGILVLFSVVAVVLFFASRRHHQSDPEKATSSDGHVDAYIPPPLPVQLPPVLSTKAALMEIQQRPYIPPLTATTSGYSSMSPPVREQELRNQIRVLEEQVNVLQTQLVVGPPDFEPPPEYSGVVGAVAARARTLKRAMKKGIARSFSNK